ncbi:MAG: DNA cytosine methyltransferase [Chloroflexi bacterium]|nr:DNA cytosine methyltransferase [Chloroflexota bacterium]
MTSTYATNGVPADHDHASTADHSHVERLTFLDFFAGAGLVRLGLEPSWSCVWANDIDSRKQQIYEAHFGSENFVLGDVAGIRTDSLPAGADMAWASFPCQDLSLAGWRKGMRAERSGTYWEFWRLMRDSLYEGDRPPLIVIENVVGMLYGKNFPILCESLADLGMQFGPLVIDARQFLPQSRPRVFVVAVDSRVDCSLLVNEEVTEAPWFTKAAKSAHTRFPATLRDSWRWWKLPEPSSTISPVEDIIEGNPTSVQWHEPKETKRLLAMMTDVNSRKTERAIERGRSVGFIYKRIRQGVQRAEVRFDGVAGCLRTPQGGSSRQIVLAVDEGTVRSRLLSPREAARLMGVPDSFWLPSRYNDAYRAIGDGVAVPVVRWLSDQLLVNLARLCRDSRVDTRAKDQGDLVRTGSAVGRLLRRSP